MPISEPLAEQLQNPVLRYFLATRPPFLLASAAPVLIGLSTAFYGGAGFNLFYALLTLLGAVLAQAGANVINDYYDALNGTDRLNTDRIYPFTGGSRFIQNGVLTEEETARYAALLFAAVVIIGLVLLSEVGLPLLWLGLGGLFLAWAYSSPPLLLNARGLGELSVALGFGLLIVAGADLVQRGSFDPLPFYASFSYGLLTAALLYINQFPDRAADERAGKRHWVVRLGPQKARWGYLLLVLGAYGGVAIFVLAGRLPPLALLAFAALPFHLKAAADLLRYAAEPARLTPAIPLTISGLLVHGGMLALGLALAVWL